MLHKKQAILTVLVVALTLAFGAAHAQDGEPLVIGVLTDHSGVLQNYGFEQTNGFELGLDFATGGTLEVGGRPIEFIVRDNSSDPDTAAQQARELIEVEGAEILVGTVSTGVTLGLRQIAAENEVILMMGPSAGANLTAATNEEEQALLDNAFRACRTSSQDAFAGAAWGVENVGENYVIFAPDTAFGQASAVGWEQAITALGGQFIQGTIFAPFDTTDFTPFAQQIIDSGADGYVLIWAGTGTATLFQQFDELGVNEAVTPLFPFSSVDDLLAAGTVPGTTGVGIYHWTLPDTEINDWLVEQHNERFGEFPDLFSECGFATAQAIVLGIERAIENGADPIDATLPENLAPALEGLQWEGPKGHYELRAGDHQALVPMYVARVTEVLEDDLVFELIDEVLPDEYDLPCISLNC